MSDNRVRKAIIAGFLLATATSIFVHLRYQFLIFREHRGEQALSFFRATGKVDAATFGAFGYHGFITTVRDEYGDDQVVDINVNTGAAVPVTFDLSYLSRMFILWHALTWMSFGIALAISVPVALWTPLGERFISISGVLLAIAGSILLVGAFVLRGYLGLDGLGSLDSVQTTNLVLGPTIALVGLWLMRKEPLHLFRRARLIPSLRYVIALLAIWGVWTSILSWRVHNSEDGSEAIRAICSPFKPWDCGTAERSPLSEFLGFPVAVFGVAGYTALLMLSVYDTRRSRQIQFSLATAAEFLALILIYRYTTASDITNPLPGKWCEYCIILQSITALILFNSGFRLFLARGAQDDIASDAKLIESHKS